MISKLNNRGFVFRAAFVSCVIVFSLLAVSNIRLNFIGPNPSSQRRQTSYLRKLETQLHELEDKLVKVKEGDSDPQNELDELTGKIVRATTTNSNKFSYEHDCKPKTKVAFAKTHKTGSSTLQNIIFRYGVGHDLTFAIPPKSWMFSFKETFKSEMVLHGPWAPLKNFDLFAFHSVWNHPEIKKVIPKAFTVTLLREPLECFESNYVYMGLEKAFKMDVNSWAQKRAKKMAPRRSKAIIGKNQMLWDLGLSTKDMENHTKVEEKIRVLDDTMDLVMIVERFGMHTGLLTYARSKTVPRAASASRFGVCTTGLPAKPR